MSETATTSTATPTNVYQIGAGGNCVAASNGSTSTWDNAPSAFVTFIDCTDPRTLWTLTKEGYLYNEAEKCYLGWGDISSGNTQFSCWTTPKLPPNVSSPFFFLPFSMSYTPDMSRNTGNGNMGVTVTADTSPPVSTQVGYLNNLNGQNHFLASASPGSPNNASISIIPGGYSCDIATSTCVPVAGANAQFSTLEECQAQCKPGVSGWSCDPNTGKCVPNPNGTWTSQTACDAKCTYNDKRAKEIAVAVMIALAVVIIGVFVWLWYRGRRKGQTEQQKIVNLLTEPVPPSLAV